MSLPGGLAAKLASRAASSCAAEIADAAGLNCSAARRCSTNRRCLASTPALTDFDEASNAAGAGAAVAFVAFVAVPALAALARLPADNISNTGASAPVQAIEVRIAIVGRLQICEILIRRATVCLSSSARRRRRNGAPVTLRDMR